MATWGVLERNSLSGEQLPRIGAIRCVNPAHNGEAHTGCLAQGRGDRRRVMPWEALYLDEVWPRND